ncbi:5-methyltetrahydropteroyltriglutamate--homocysteine S-methyltransferase [Desulforamulus ruminis]|uniref:5-methyltetrahydropteroyltriglutamate--homocysteine methyltransferase n=1 Tax=Desulforamulus ruminis (strain ATCC 23193 / DSM 2154 / NCIMB 8452 / DL) TaxID=696281 RepID=F6DJU7_DESRL|nr:5-methyltetrahydropteroyltriglutamate--homocysteine S-methyltransferase [Desulforamulus ruminis]AEG59161.1 5-methyltetrahydropteroyltriglutamate/homocysteine S-methyltransferase [Desulforamulus ruminis DSM 2154]
MQLLSTVGYPRIGAQRELKKWVESYFNGKLSKEELLQKAAEIRKQHWSLQAEKGVYFIPSNDFSFYDTFLDTAFLLNVIPDSYRRLGLDDLGTYFAMAKGYQDAQNDAKALPMKKWFNTNYHYMVPMISDSTKFMLNSRKPFAEYVEALGLGIKTKPVLIGPFTFLKLSKINHGTKTYRDYIEDILPVYEQILNEFNELKADYLQVDEPILVTDLTAEDIEIFQFMYKKLLSKKKNVKILLQTYFGDVRDVYEKLISLDFDALGLDFVEGPRNLELIKQYGFPKDKVLFVGVVNGKNIWKNHYSDTLKKLDFIAGSIEKNRIVLNTSCSLLHVPYTVKNETQLAEKYKIHFAFAEEKLDELMELAELFHEQAFEQNERYIRNQRIIKEKLENKEYWYEDVRKEISSLTESDFQRMPSFAERIKLQKNALNLPLLPTTTIGSFPQTSEIRELRKQYKNQGISHEQYQETIKQKITELIQLQEKIGLDVLVHGEFERNDMVEYFGENLAGFLFTRNAWVQSYGTRCVKPPIIFGDVRRNKAITVDYIDYAQSLTSKPIKGMLTGPVTILNWSFPREDLCLENIAYQIALAIKAEVMDLEAKGIKIIQIDEAALREKLPLRKKDWYDEYLCWAIKAFRLVHASVKPHTQIHTHMCYSEFEDIIKEIDDMDADVITFEAARSDLSIIDVLNANHFRTEVGPGVYDIHSPRVPGKEEIEEILMKMIHKLDLKKLWVNPDCGLKTRGMEETVPSLQHMVAAAKDLRKKLL